MALLQSRDMYSSNEDTAFQILGRAIMIRALNKQPFNHVILGYLGRSSR